MSKVRVCFLGTPIFAKKVLENLLLDEHFEVVGVVTQPDRPAGRKMQLTACPVKQLALDKNIQVISPEKVSAPEILEQLKNWKTEVAIVVAFGQILSTKFLESFPFGAVNIHGSLLPKWRGAAPIQRSIEAGDQVTGVTLQKIVKELDAGDILGVREISVDENLSAMELHDLMISGGSELLKVELMDFVRGNLTPVPQDVTQVTFAPKISKEECHLDWKMSAQVLHNKVRAYTMGPGAFSILTGKRLKIHKSKLSKSSKLDHSLEKCGEILGFSDSGVLIQTGHGFLELIEVQPESKSRISALDLAKTGFFQIGERLV